MSGISTRKSLHWSWIQGNKKLEFYRTLINAKQLSVSMSSPMINDRTTQARVTIDAATGVNHLPCSELVILGQ